SYVARAAAAGGAEVLCVGRRPGPVGRHVFWDAAAGVPELGGADLVVHCAAAVGDHPVGSLAEAGQYEVNVGGTGRLLAAAAGRPVVWVSSASVYSPRPGGAPVRESHPTVDGHLNGYGRSKALGERLALDAGAVVLRPRAVYGVGDPHLVPRLLARVRGGVLALPGRDVALSLTAVENLAQAALAAPGWPPGAYNVADAVAYRRDEVVRRVLRAYGVRARIVHVPLALARLARSAELTPYALDQLARSVVLDTGRARAQGWVPRYGLADHLAAVVRTAEGARTP
uniref:NAD-dependent epimerase/dehydratase family protein n=1 Tax=Kitasatospora sp. MBT63 TaxID=1444768 RepID=UPI00053A9FC2